MMKKSLFPSPSGSRRPGGRIPKLIPPAKPGWYKRFKQLASRADKSFRIK